MVATSNTLLPHKLTNLAALLPPHRWHSIARTSLISH